MRGRTGWATTAITVALVAAGTAEAKVYEVTRTNDPPPNACKKRDCSLREAVLAANVRAGEDTILLPSRKKPYRLTRAGAGEDVGETGDLDINNHPLAIVHRGKGRATIDGGGLDRVLHIQAGAATGLIKIAITNGATISDGGGILTDASLLLRRSVVARNAGDDGGGIDLDVDADLTMQRSALRGNTGDGGGGVNTAGAGTLVKVVQSTIAGNKAGDDGGGLELAGGETLRIIRSTIANNMTGSLGGGVAAVGTGVVTVTSSTISGNRAEGAFSEGGGLFIEGPTATITNSTIAHNRAQSTGGGIQTSGNATQISLNSVTVARNKADHAGGGGTLGGGLHNEDSLSFEVRNSVIALNFSDTTRNDCEGNLFQSLGNNLLSTGFECDGFNMPGDLVRDNPKLAKLKRNGGPTKTMALRKGSPAIAKAHKPSAPKRDQRGRKRDRKPDIGAYERGA